MIGRQRGRQPLSAGWIVRAAGEGAVSGRTAVGCGRAAGGPRRAAAGRPGIGYVPALDGMRGLAVMAVLAFHGGMPWAARRLPGRGRVLRAVRAT